MVRLPSRNVAPAPAQTLVNSFRIHPASPSAGRTYSWQGRRLGLGRLLIVFGASGRSLIILLHTLRCELRSLSNQAVVLHITVPPFAVADAAGVGLFGALDGADGGV